MALFRCSFGEGWKGKEEDRVGVSQEGGKEGKKGERKSGEGEE